MDALIAICFGGLFCLVLVVPYSIFVGLMYVVYRATNGKMKFREYVKYW